MVYYGYDGREYEDAEMDNMKRDRRESIDHEGALHVPVVKVNLPCEECKGTNYPNLKYSILGMTGILCRSCIVAVVDQINQALADTQEQEESKD